MAGVGLTNESAGLAVSTVNVASADFADGTVTNGQVMQLTIVPEPGAIGLALIGAAVSAAALRRR